MSKNIKHDFSGYATRVGLKCSDGRTILPDAFQENDGQTVPLVWQHLHNEPSNILGHAILENRSDGVYAYCSLNNSPAAQDAKEAIIHGDIKALSIYANSLVEKGKNVVHGLIREVSLVIAGANAGAYIDNLAFQHGDGSVTEDETEAIISAYSDLELFHEELPNDEETIADVFNTLNEKQKSVVYAMISEALLSSEEDNEVSHDSLEDNEDENSDENEDADESLAHFGVRGMKWGVRKAVGDAAGKVSSGVKKYSDHLKKTDEDWKNAGKGMPSLKKSAIGAALGPYWGAKAIKRMESKAPEKALKKEMKNASKTINKEYNKKIYGKDGVLAKVNRENQAKFGKNLLGSKAQNDDWYKQLAKQSEKAFNDTVKETLGSSNKFKIVITDKQTGDAAPGFKLVPNDSPDVKHSFLMHAKLNELKINAEFDSSGLVKKFDIPENFYDLLEEEDYDIPEDEDEDEIKQSDIKGDLNDMKKNVFDNSTKEGEKNMEHNALTTVELRQILDDARRSQSSLKNAFLAHGFDSIADAYMAYEGNEEDKAIQHSITNIGYLFPDHKATSSTPQIVARKTEWVKDVFDAAKHIPFARIKTLVADLTADEARALGYVKGNEKVEEVFSLLKRTTDPQTVYKKQKIDRDDLIDITDFDVVVWLRNEMRVMLEEELARAILIGDGRSIASDDKIVETKIRPIATDDALYTVPVNVEATGTNTEPTTDEIIDAIIRARADYRGNGIPSFFTTSDILSDMLLLKDSLGRRIHNTIADLTAALRVSKIVEVPVMGTVVNPDTSVLDYSELAGVIVNMNDYSIGADKGGNITMMDDFDIDFNQYKYLIETRISGALTVPHSALAIWIEKPEPVTPSA